MLDFTGLLQLRSSKIKVYIQQLSPDARIPTQANPADAGFDLYSAQGLTIEVGDRALVPTDIALAIPSGWVGLVWPRSGLAVRQGVDTMAGVIDSGYRGNVQVLIINHGQAPLVIEKGTRIAQLLVQQVADIEFVAQEQLPDSVRADGGFGSSGSQ